MAIGAGQGQQRRLAVLSRRSDAVRSCRTGSARPLPSEVGGIMTRTRMTRLIGAVAALALVTVASRSAAMSTAATATGAAANGLIAYQSEKPAGDHTQVDIYTIEADGTGPVRLTRTPQFNE